MSARRLQYLFTLAVPFAVLAAALAWILNLDATAQSKYVYDTSEVTRGSIRRIVSTSGPVRALVTVSVGSQLSGQIETVNADFNSVVKPGDILARLDSKTYEAKVASARADLIAAQALLVNQEAALRKAEAALKLAELNIDRQNVLSSKGLSARSALDSAIRDIEVGRAEIGVAKAQIESARANVAQRQAALDERQIDLERTEIRSPIDGIVISRSVDPGQTVAASLQAPELFKIAQDLSLIRIEASVNEADVGAIAEGNPATFNVDAYPDRQFEGRVTQVRMAATEVNNVVTYTVIIEAQNGDRKLFPGMTANVLIETAKRDGVLRIPNDALRFRPKTDGPPPSGSDMAGRLDRIIERVKDELQLSVEQSAILKSELDKLAEDMQSGSGSTMTSPAIDQSYMRQKVQSRIEQTLGPLLTEQQRPLFDNWRKGREQTRPGAVWVETRPGTLERRFVRTGISDDQFTEVVGGELKEGERAVLRAREAKP
jgi:HlyD family secretion protein